MAALRKPSGLGPGGTTLWRAVTSDHSLDVAQQMQLVEACRAKDRLDKLDEVLRGDTDTWMRLAEDLASDGQVFELRVTDCLVKANQTATVLKQLLAALRLPDEASGKRPQQRGGARGAYTPGGAGTTGSPRPSGKVSSLERARAARSS